MDLGGSKAFLNQQRKQTIKQALRGRPVLIYLWRRNGLHFGGLFAETLWDCDVYERFMRSGGRRDLRIGLLRRGSE